MVAVAHGGDIQINYETVIEPEAMLIVIYNQQDDEESVLRHCGKGYSRHVSSVAS